MGQCAHCNREAELGHDQLCEECRNAMIYAHFSPPMTDTVTVPRPLLREALSLTAAYTSMRHVQASVQKNPAVKAELLKEIDHVMDLEKQLRAALTGRPPVTGALLSRLDTHRRQREARGATPHETQLLGEVHAALTAAREREEKLQDLLSRAAITLIGVIKSDDVQYGAGHALNFLQTRAPAFADVGVPTYLSSLGDGL